VTADEAARRKSLAVELSAASKQRDRVCLTCGGVFPSPSPAHRTCPPCKGRRNMRTWQSAEGAGRRAEE
jgi:hypothetical protein